MKIKRTLMIGDFSTEVEIKLTPQELLAAYEEKEHLYDVECVRNRVDSGCYTDADGEDIEFSDDDIDGIADETRRLIDRYEMDFDYALDDAMKAFVDEYNKNIEKSIEEE